MSDTVKSRMVPRNHVARSPLMRKGGVHEKSATVKRQQSRDAIRGQLDNWREDVAFETAVRVSLNTSDDDGD